MSTLMANKPLRVAMIATPWLAIPPIGYGGIEQVVYALVPELLNLGVEVELFATGDSTVQTTKTHYLYDIGQYEHIHKPFYSASPILVAHLLYAINKIREDGHFDIIHDHNNALGPLLMSNLCSGLPPVVHTHHGPPFSTPDRLSAGLPDNLPMWDQLSTAQRFYIIGISDALMSTAPKSLKPIILPSVHNAVNTDVFPFEDKKDDYFITLARFHPDKGQAIAVKACEDLGLPLKMAGVVGDMKTRRQLMLELANPLSAYRGLVDFRYFSDEIFQHLDDDLINYVGDLSGERKLTFIKKARALLFPIQWDEPFGMAPIEALACGTPVIAMARGALPEIIEHGVNGFLAKNATEFKKFMQRIDEIDPAACRKSVEDKFSAPLMAQRYLDRYKYVIAKHAPGPVATKR